MQNLLKAFTGKGLRVVREAHPGFVRQGILRLHGGEIETTLCAVDPDAASSGLDFQRDCFLVGGPKGPFALD